MSTIAERVLTVVKETGGNMSEFARRIGVTPAYISKLKNEPDRIPSDRTIADICRIFDIQEDWLRYGLEPMRTQKSREEEIAEMVAAALGGSNEFRMAVIRMICTRTDDELKALESALQAVYDDLKKEKSQG